MGMKYCLPAMMLLVLMVCACPAGKPAFRQVGSTVLFDPGQREIPFVKAEEYRPFVRQYPKDWPKRIELPRGAYLSQDGKIYESTTSIDGVEHRTYVAEMVVRHQIDDIRHIGGVAVKYYEMQEVSSSEYDPPGEWRLEVTYEGGTAGIRQLYLAWYDARFLGDWCYGEVHIVLY